MYRSQNHTTNRYPFGMPMPGRNYSFSQPYSFGFNTQLKDDEIYGAGNMTTAKYWQYDSRLGRRWNRDPITYPWQSPYATNNNNPLYFYDPLGLYGKKKKAERKQQKMAKKMGEDHIGEVFNRNEGTDKKEDWGFHVFGEGKDKYTRTSQNEEGVTATAYRPDASIFSNKGFKSAKSKFGLYNPMAISASASFVFAGGGSYTVGWAQDKFGNSTGFQTVGGGVGLELGLGLNAGKIEGANGNTFTIDMLDGDGFQYSGGVGPLSIAKSGDITKAKLFNKNGVKYNIIDGGFSNDLKALKLLKLSKLKLGGSYQWNKTYLFGTKIKEK